jgi:hypothetical protein
MSPTARAELDRLARGYVADPATDKYFRGQNLPELGAAARDCGRRYGWKSGIDGAAAFLTWGDAIKVALAPAFSEANLSGDAVARVFGSLSQEEKVAIVRRERGATRVFTARLRETGTVVDGSGNWQLVSTWLQLVIDYSRHRQEFERG